MRTRAVRNVLGIFGFHTVVLITVGGRSGVKRETVVVWLPGSDGGGVVVAAAGGTATNPA